MSKAIISKLVFGVGVNDANYPIVNFIDGKDTRCQYYTKWKEMLRRCYSERWKSTRQSYKGCTACDEWLTFSNFKKWMEQQNWKCMDLDKDILKQGNKVYSPETCLFVPQEINKLLTDGDAIRGKYPKGVYFNKKSKKYIASISKYSSHFHLGTYKTVEEAETAYKKAKAGHIYDITKTQIDKRLRYALKKRALRMVT